MPPSELRSPTPSRLSTSDTPTGPPSRRRCTTTSSSSPRPTPSMSSGDAHALPRAELPLFAVQLVPSGRCRETPNASRIAAQNTGTASVIGRSTVVEVVCSARTMSTRTLPGCGWWSEPGARTTTASYASPVGDGLRTRSCMEVVSETTSGSPEAIASSRISMRYRPDEPGGKTGASQSRVSR